MFHQQTEGIYEQTDKDTTLEVLGAIALTKTRNPLFL